MSQATSFTSVAQQLSISAGVTVAALILETLRYSRGTSAILVSDFQIAFLIVGAISLSCILFVLPLPKDAGSALTRRPPAAKEAAAEAAAETDRQILGRLLHKSRLMSAVGRCLLWGALQTQAGRRAEAELSHK